MRLRDWLIATGLVVLGITVAWLRLESRPPAWPRPLTDFEVAQAWVQCIDCRGPFLKRLAEMPARNRDSVTQFLSTALLDGPGNDQIRRQQQDLLRVWRTDSVRRASRGEPPRSDAQQDDFLNRYGLGFQVKWRSRAAIALGVIRSAPALAALDTLLGGTPDNRADSAVWRWAQRAKADRNRSVLAHYP